MSRFTRRVVIRVHDTVSMTSHFARIARHDMTDAAHPERPGKLKNGFNITARDLDRAVVVAGFGDLHMLLIEQARELSYARAKLAKIDDPLPFAINISALARDTGKDRKWLTVRFHDLVRYRVFLPLSDGGYLINKDYRQWLDDDGNPRLTVRQIAWCGSTRLPVAGLPQSKWVPCGNPATPPCGRPATPPVADLPQATHFNTSPPLGTPLVNAPATHAREFETELEIKRENTPLTPPHGGGSSRVRRLGKKERQEQIVAENVRLALEGLFPKPKPPEDSGNA